MKRILGLDLGTTSIGWALVNEAENNEEQSTIIRLGVRVNPLSVDERSNFEKGKSITTNADRTLKRSMRRNLQRYKLRRAQLRKVLIENGFISEDTLLSENGKNTTYESYRLRAKAAKEEITLEQLARVLLMINKKRGYKSSRKLKGQDEGQIIDGMTIAKKLYDENLTPGEYLLSLHKEGKKYSPDFYRSDLLDELDKIWSEQSKYYPEILTEDFRKQIEGKGKLNTSKIFLAKYQIYTADNKAPDKKGQALEWRVKATKEKLPIEEMAFVIADVNGSISNSSGYLGEISDRSKELYFKKQTVGQNLYEKLISDRNFSLRNKTFYRQDYLDEFEKIWETQAKYHKELTPKLKKEIRDIIIFYQRRLKSQKGLINICEFEGKEIEYIVDGKAKKKLVGPRVCPKSSPLFQEFKIWQILNNVKVISKKDNADRFLYPEEMDTLAQELAIRESLKSDDALKILFNNYKDFKLNYEKLEGNRTISSLFDAYKKIVELSGHDISGFTKQRAPEVINAIKEVFTALGFNTGILWFDSLAKGKDLENQPLYILWHLLYSFEGDNSRTGNEALINKIMALTSFPKEFAAIISSISFQPDYGSLSTKAICKIIPHLKDGIAFAGRKERPEEPSACEYAGYRHSKHSLTKEEIENKKLLDRLEIIKKNSLRNPVVEKILNQMVNVVNAVIEKYGRPDEIRLELARELKNSAEERKSLTDTINKNTIENEQIRKILRTEFGLQYISRNDIIRYKLYKELEYRGYKTLYTNTYIPKEKLFSEEFDIEHIIPRSRLFDDSFSNKTLETREANIEKGNDTAYDYVLRKYGQEGLDSFLACIKDLEEKRIITGSKYKKLKTSINEIPDDFIDRDLRDTQYIARKAKEILETISKHVVTTTGSITARLREDWQLVDVMKDLNWDKYKALGLTEEIEGKNGQRVRVVKDWTKRNDHRHHAVDALVIAFTKRSYIQYLNNLNARSDKGSEIFAIEAKELERDNKGKLRFKAPIEIKAFRTIAKEHLENVLVSIKAKNKVVTRNINITKKKNGLNKKIQLTPRGQLHNETIYGSALRYVSKEEKVGAAFNEELINKVANKKYREALLNRLHTNGGDPKKAFTGKNSLAKQPIYLDKQRGIVVPDKVKIVNKELIYTIRKEVAPGLNVEKVLDKKVRLCLEARLKEYNNDPKKAFSNIDEYPIWLNKEKGIKIRRVTITGVANAQALHDKNDKDGKPVLDEYGNPIPVDFVNTGNNHHVAIYRDSKGILQERVVSFLEATTRAVLGLTIIDKEYNSELGWEFLFSMKQNEYFVFPDKDFKPNEIDLMKSENYSDVSPHLFRVQKLSTKDYWFRHHLDTTVDVHNALKGIAWLRIGPSGLEGAVKVRINHIGEIVFVGEE
jgi:CRISPR-associated endonuclease Csn1